MASKPSGEGKAPLVISLVFFVLLSLGLGVMLYMAGDEKAQLREAAKKAKADEDAAKKAMASEQEKLALYKVAVGTGSQEDWDLVKNARDEAAVRAEYDKLVNELANRVGTRERPGPLSQAAAKDFVGVPGQAFSLAAGDLFSWQWPASGKPEREPTTTLLASAVSAHARGQLAVNKANAAIKNAAAAETAYKQGLDEATKEKQNLTKAAADFPPAIAKIQAEADAAKAATRGTFATKTKEYTESERAMKEQLAAKDIRIGELERLLAAARERSKRLDEELNEIEDPFPFDTPHGRIIDRRGSTVTINLGSSDRVRPGLTFNVRPADALQPGSNARLVPKLDRSGRPMYKNGKPVMVTPEKGSIEVTQVLGPNTSLARITDNPDPIRDGIMTGDLLFNSAWRTEGADRVALFGIFDLDGDGVDDTRSVVRDLQKMGIPVDAVFDLEQRKWIDPATQKPTAITPQTTYTVEGYYPPPTGGEAIVGAKSAIDTALRQARTEAQERGSKVVRMREFFPRIGLRIRMDVSPDAINRAYSRYLVTLPPADGADGGANPPKNN